MMDNRGKMSMGGWGEQKKGKYQGTCIHLAFISGAVGLNVGHTLQATSHKQENDSKFEKKFKVRHKK